MIGMTVTIEDSTKRVVDASEKGAFRSLSHAAASISRDVKSTIERSSEPSKPGEPPHTRGQPKKNIKGAIRYVADKDSAIIGPTASFVGDVGEVHEFGGDRRGTVEIEDFPERSFMEPGLRRAEPRFVGQFYGSIGE